MPPKKTNKVTNKATEGPIQKGAAYYRQRNVHLNGKKNYFNYFECMLSSPLLSHIYTQRRYELPTA